MGGLTPDEALQRVNDKAATAQTARETYEEVLDAMEHEGIRVRNETELSEGQDAFLPWVFRQRGLPAACATYSQQPCPVALFARQPDLPRRQDGIGCCPGKCRYAVLRIPVNAACPRFVEMPSRPAATTLFLWTTLSGCA